MKKNVVVVNELFAKREDTPSGLSLALLTEVQEKTAFHVKRGIEPRNKMCLDYLSDKFIESANIKEGSDLNSVQNDCVFKVVIKEGTTEEFKTSRNGKARQPKKTSANGMIITHKGEAIYALKYLGDANDPKDADIFVAADENCRKAMEALNDISSDVIKNNVSKKDHVEAQKK
jgi:hypothetical protein